MLPLFEKVHIYVMCRMQKQGILCLKTKIKNENGRNIANYVSLRTDANNSSLEDVAPQNFESQ